MEVKIINASNAYTLVGETVVLDEKSTVFSKVVGIEIVQVDTKKNIIAVFNRSGIHPNDETILTHQYEYKLVVEDDYGNKNVVKNVSAFVDITNFEELTFWEKAFETRKNADKVKLPSELPDLTEVQKQLLISFLVKNLVVQNKGIYSKWREDTDFLRVNKPLFTKEQCEFIFKFIDENTD